MSEINDIKIPNVVIPKFGTNEVWLNDVPFIPSNHPSVTTQIGFPIVEIPGCVKMHKDNQDKVTRMPFDHDLVNQDEDGVTTLCPHGEYPTYDAMEYTPEQLIIQRETPPPEVVPPPTPPEFEADAIPDTSAEKEFLCPAPNQPRVGDLTQKGDERVIGHEEQEIDGVKTCVVLYEDTSLAEKLLPSTNQVSTTAAIAVVATAAAAATPLLLRIIKPIIKKATDTIRKKLGKEVKNPSSAEIIADEYRKKKGLPPIKKKK